MQGARSYRTRRPEPALRGIIAHRPIGEQAGVYSLAAEQRDLKMSIIRLYPRIERVDCRFRPLKQLQIKIVAADQRVGEKREGVS